MILRLLTEAQAGCKSLVSIRDALEYSRDQYGLTQAEYAALIGMRSTHYSEVLSGKRTLPIGAVKRAYAIGVPAVALLQNITQ